MKKLYTPFVAEIAKDPERLRDELINIMMITRIEMNDLCEELKMMRNTLAQFIEGSRNTQIATRRLIASWIEEKQKQLV